MPENNKVYALPLTKGELEYLRHRIKDVYGPIGKGVLDKVDRILKEITFPIGTAAWIDVTNNADHWLDVEVHRLLAFRETANNWLAMDGARYTDDAVRKVQVLEVKE